MKRNSMVCIMLLAPLGAPLPVHSIHAQPVKNVLLKVDVDLKDATLEFILDDREIPAKTLAAPLPLRHGPHELAVLRQGTLIELLSFDIGPNTGPELTLKRKEPPPGEDEPDFRPTTVKPSSPTPLSRAELRARGEWVPLFNGKDRTGWRNIPKIAGGWHVENGIFIEQGIFGGLFTLEDDWTDVHLRIEAKITGAGSGVCLRAPFQSKPGKDGYDVFIGGKFGTGSVRVAGRDVVQVKDKLVPPDTWFTLDVILRGHHIVVHVNGKVVADYEDKQKATTKGHIVLQPMFSKGNSIHYKRIEARDLDPKRVDKQPAAFPEEKVPPRTTDNGRHVVQTIPLADALSHPHLMLARAPGGGFKLGWNDAKHRTRITSLTEDLKPVGADIVLPENHLRGLAVNDDGTILALVFQPPCAMVALGLNSAGQVLFQTPLTGENGSGPGTHFATKWFWSGKLVSSGKEFAVHFGHFVHLKGGAKHQGGYFARLDDKGNKLQQNHWTVSHSLDQALLFHRGDWFTASVGDAFPVGIPFINRSQKKARSLIYPAKDQRDAFRPKLTHMSRLVGVGEEISLAFVTRVGETWQTHLAFIDKTGEVKRLINLTDRVAPSTHAGVNLARFGSDLLLMWSVTDSTTYYVPIDSAGRFLGRPTLVEQPLMLRRNDLAFFANGDVAWLTAPGRANAVTVVRVKR